MHSVQSLHLSRSIISSLPSGRVPSFKTIASLCRLRIPSSMELCSLRRLPSTNIPSKSSPAVPSPLIILTSLGLGTSHSKSIGRSFALQSSLRAVGSLMRGSVSSVNRFLVRSDSRKLICRSLSSLPQGSFASQRSINRAFTNPSGPDLSTSCVRINKHPCSATSRSGQLSHLISCSACS